MKREGYIFDRIICPENLRRALRNASKRKKGKREVKQVLCHEQRAIDGVRKLLLEGFAPSPYTVMRVYDGAAKKERVIEKPRFYPDQIVHWALIMQIKHLIMRGMYDWSCGSIPGRGQARCKRGVERWLRGYPEGTKYCLKLDIRKFYQSIDHEVAKAQFRRIIKDPRTLSLIDAIIDSTDGLNIGNFTSQWFANFYLQPADHFIKERLRRLPRAGKRGEKTVDAVIYYARYIDDMVLFGRNKKALRRARKLLFSYLENELRLTVKKNWQLFPVDARDVDFLGYRMNHARTILRGRLSLRIARRARKIAKKPTPSHGDCAAMISYHGYIRHSDSRNYSRKRVEPYVDIAAMERRMSNDNRAKQQKTGVAPRGAAGK